MTSLRQAPASHPLTSPQRDIWFDQLLHGDTPLYNIGGYMRLAGHLDVALFMQSAKLLVQKFDVLRTVLRERCSDDEDALPMQGYADTLPVIVPFLDVSTEADPHEAAMAWMRQRFSEPFSLQGEPLFRYALLKLADDAFFYFACYHHLIADGWTIALLARAHAEIYAALAAGEEPELTAPSYSAFIENDRSYVDSPAFATQQQYWLQKFQPLPEPLFVPHYRGEAPTQSPPSQCSTLSLPRDWYNRLIGFANEHGASTFHAILAALYVYFTRTAQRDEVVMGLPVLNRSNAAFKATAGLFVGVTAARFCFGTELSFAELLQAIGRELKQNYRHQRFPFSALNRSLDRASNAGQQLFDIGVSYERHNYEAAFGEARGMAIPLVNEYQSAPLMLYVREFHDDEAVLVDFVYHKAYFTSDEIAAIQQRLLNLLDAAQQMPHALVKALPMLTAAEQRQLTVEWNATAVDYPQARPVHELIELQAEATPDALALVFEETQLSYRELNTAANRLAHRLIAAGVCPDTLVGICTERSIEMVIGLLAILKAGAAYMPLDPDYPTQRLAYMLGDAGNRLLLTQNSVWSRLGLEQEGLQVMDLDMALAAPFPSTNPDVAIDPRQLAYTIYTSGSTGKPKGAGIPHGGLTNRLLWMQDTYRLTRADRVLQKTPFSFDVSVWEFFWPLMTGATLVVAKPGDHKDPARLAELIQRHGITTLHFVPAMLQAFVEHEALPQCASLRRVFASGEALPAELQQRFYQQSKAVLYNLYGPTEASIDVTAWTCIDEPALTVPIGKPIANTKIYLLDADMEPVPAGVEGELYIGGVQLARGYHRRPDLTAERFVPDPFGPPGERLYRTGDLARWRMDGAIEYLGRADHQVKIRGLRIELGEIESALLTHPEVREAVVMACEEEAGNKRLVAYLTTHAAVTAEALRAHLQSCLPDYMTPSAFVFLDTLPLSPNGKIDRRALPAPSQVQSDYIAPRTPTEILLAQVWSELLKCGRIGAYDHFFALGGHSLLAVRLVSRLRKLIGVELPLRSIFAAPVLHELAQRLDEACSHSGLRENELEAETDQQADDAGWALLEPADRSAALPLSFAQQRLWFLDQMETGSAFYNMAGGLRLAGELDIAALEAAMNDIVQRHEALRTTYELIGDSAVQVIAEHARVPLLVTDLSGLPLQERDTEARKLALREAEQPFDLRTAPLLRAHLIRLDAQEHWLLLTLHHIAADGWSMDILQREIAAFYYQHKTNVPAALAPLPLQYADFALWQRKLPHKPEWERQLDYWRNQLAQAPALLELPTDHARPAVQSYRGARIRFALPGELAKRLHALSRDNGATLFMTLLSAFGVLLSRYSAQDDICIGTPVANRRHTEFDGLIGCFINTLVLRLKLQGNAAFTELLSQARETALDAYAHQDMPFERLVDVLQPERDLSHAPLFQVMFTLENNATHKLMLDGLDAQQLDIDLPISKFDLTLTMREEADRLEGMFEYNTDLFERATIMRISQHFHHLLEAIIAQPEMPVAELPLLSNEEQRQILVEWNQTHVPLPPARTIQQLFETCVQDYPDRIAAVFQDQQLSYAELNVRANRLAHYLREQGVGADALVGICIERSLDMIIAVLGVLKAGGAYLPLSPTLPPSRMAYMIEDARPRLLLTEEDLLGRLPQMKIAQLCLDRDAAMLSAQPVHNPLEQTLPEHLAYVIYTSGSTGNPKGTLIHHRGLINLVLALREAFDLQPGKRVLQWASFNFDASVLEIFTTLTAGSQLYLASSEAVLPGQNLLDTLRRYRIEFVMLTPSSLSALPLEPLPDLKTLAVGGEHCDHALIAPWMKHYTVINAYGPTEATVCATVYPCADDGQRHPPIGRPIANTQTYILDKYLNPVPIGVTGELYIGGEGLARGYLGRPDLTAERFLQNPFSDQPGARMYKTGDLARYLPDGHIEYIGRIDHQVKIRGYRIELGEIEFALTQLSSVREAVVLTQEAPAGGRRLVAYVVLESAVSAEHDSSTLRTALGRTLPEYMVPAHFVFLPHIPVNTNSKVDRKALDALEWMEDELVYAALCTPTEERLAALWSELLGKKTIGRDENFFHLGGHSLLATQAVSQIRKVFGTELPLRAIFEAPLLRELALRVEQAQGKIDRGEPALAPVDRSAALPLSFAQQRLWFLDQMETGSAFYNMAGGLRLMGELDIAALEAALKDIVLRHEVLRTSYAVVGNNAVQVVAAQARVPFLVTDLSSLPLEERNAEARKLAQQEAEQPFDLRTTPLLRAHVLLLDAHEHWLLLTLHHIAADGWSMDILQREIAAFYYQHKTNTPAALHPLSLQYADFALWQSQLPHKPEWERQLDYWRNQLAQAPALLELPTDHARPVVQSYQGARLRFALPSELVQRLHTLSRENGATLFMALLSAFGVLLSRYSAQDDLCIGTPVANRRHAELEGLIGCFINTLVLRLKLQGNVTFSELLSQVRETALDAYAHQDIPFEHLVEVLQPERSLSHAPLFQVMFALENNATHQLMLDGLEAQPLDIDLPVSKFDLTLTMREEAERLEGVFEYNTDLFERATIERMVGHFVTLLTAIVGKPDTPVARLDMLTTQERRFLLEQLNQSQHDFPLDRSYAALFAEQVAHHPDKIAAVCMDESFTYRELDERSTRIARALVAAGAGPNTLVGVVGERSLCFLTMMIAIFKAGAAYVPLDIRHPAQRLQDIVSRGQIPLILVSEGSLTLLDPLLSGLEHAPVTLIAERLWLDGDATPLPPIGAPDDLAYVIFTSGSTGQPKGAMVEHQGMLNNLYGKVPALGLGPNDRVAQTASPAFDISVWQFLAAPLLGGTVHILPDQVAHDPQLLLQTLAEQQVSILQVVPSIMRHLVEVPVEHLSLSLRWVLSIGEALPPSLAQTWFERFPAIPLINIYGPAECADNVAYLAVRSMEEVQSFHSLASVPIGRPTANMQLFVLDAQWQPVPIGVPGEICIAGTGVGRGYLNDPATTAKAFVVHPFEPGQRFYRTGDIGRYRPDGVIHYLGRRDHQVKVRGQRIELGEIEARLCSLSGVREAVVIGHKDQRGETSLVAYWVLHAQAATEANALRAELSQSLPHYMIPAHFVMLDQLPINANGKVDRKALAVLPWQAEERPFEAPSTSVEERLAVIWSALLGQERIGRNENFFHLGGHSLLATQAISQIRKVFGVELPLRALFEAPSLRELALRIEQAQDKMDNDEPSLMPVDHSAPLPVSFPQQRLWFLDQLEPGSTMYHIPGALRLIGILNAEALKGALNDIVVRHEVLRTTFVTLNGEAVQRIAPEAKVPFLVHDLSSLKAEQRQAEAHRLAAAEISRPFDLCAAPMLRAQLLRLEPQEHWLVLTVHHIAADGWSIAIVLRELVAFYHARCHAAPAALPALPIQYADFAVWQRARQQGALHDRQLAYWRTQLDGMPALLDLPTDHPRPAVQSYRGGHFTFEIDETLTAALHTLSRHAQATLFMTLSSAFALLLARYSRQNDVCLGTPVANRQHHELEHLIGFFVNTLVLRFKLNGEMSFTRLLQQTRETALAAYTHQDLPFEQLVEALQPERHLSHAPLFQVMFVLQNTPSMSFALPDLQAEPLQIAAPSIARFDLTLSMTEQDKRLQAVFEYNADLFERETIVRMSRHFRHLLEAIVVNPETPVAELPLLTSEEQRQILVEWNQTQASLLPSQTFQHLFEACAREHADRPAVVFQEQQLSYAELNARANRLAHYLQDRGVGPDQLVAICAERSLDMIVAVLGVLKAGGAYLPIDPALPPSRMNYMLQDANPCLLLTQGHLSVRLSSTNIEQICLDRDDSILSIWPDHNPPQQAWADHLAYVIYTSGSTGNPKGTLIHHRALANLAKAQCEAFGLQPGTRVLQWVSFNFDPCVADICSTLISGACLYLAPAEELLPGPGLLHTLRRHQIEVVALTPSALAEIPVEPLPDLKTWVLGGERCENALIAPWLKTHEVINVYGPTESTVMTTAYPCAADGQRHPPIGQPIANTQTYILDEYLNPVPIGVTGELYIGGEGLARGYLGRPDLTAERFLQNPFSDQPGARMYKTGDLARYLPDGHIEYIGRIDHQVKIRGYRIELGEIEFALTQLSSVREAVVLTQEAPAGGRRLVAYVVLESAVSAEHDSSTLRTALGRTLPEYMVPAHFVFLPKIPVNTNGKLDRKALDALEWREDELVYAALCTPTEEQLAALWSELLGKKTIGRDENFFHLGGHSLLAVRLTARINETFQCALPVSQIFLSPTVATLATTIDARQGTASLVVPIKQSGHAAPVWFIHPAGGTVFCYRKLASRIDEARPVYAIQSPEIAGLDIGPWNFERVCQLYKSEITRVQADGPVYLAGWSLGGALSFRIAEMLEQEGRQVGWVGLFDTMLARDERPQEFAEFVAWAFTRVQMETLAADGVLQAVHVRATQYVEEYGTEHLMQQLSANPHYLTEELGLEANYVGFLQNQHAVQQAHIAWMAEFVPGQVNAPLHVFRAEESMRQQGAQVDWLAHTNDRQRSTQQTLPGCHENLILLDENIEVIVRVLAKDA